MAVVLPRRVVGGVDGVEPDTSPEIVQMTPQMTPQNVKYVVVGGPWDFATNLTSWVFISWIVFGVLLVWTHRSKR